MTSPRIALFVSFSGQGGVERMVTHLARGMAQAGYAVDLVLARAQSEHLRSIPPQVRVVKLGAKHTLTSLPELIRYLRRERPVAVLAAKDRAIKVAVLASRFVRPRPRLVGRLGTTVSAALEGKSVWRRAVWYANMRLFYRGLDAIVAVSQGVADDVAAITGLGERIGVVRNPVITPQLLSQAGEPVDHPWFDADVPVIVGAGRLTAQKDFPTLLRAFARLHAVMPCRLMLLGEGRDRNALEQLAEALGVAEDVALPGFAANPYAYLSRAALFVLSSRWEGSPNVLTEALALGCPVVATDCPSGPVEILQNGRFGPLVPMGDAEALAQAMERTLRSPLPAQVLRQAVEDYTLERSTRGYLAALGFGQSIPTPAPASPTRSVNPNT